MNDKKAVDIGRIMREGTLVDEAIRKATRDALLMHKKLGDPVVGWKDGKAVWIPADQIEVEEETLEGFHPLPPRGPAVSNELVDRLREDEPE